MIMAHPSGQRASALLSVEASAQHARALPCSRRSERALLEQTMRDTLQQWQNQWGIDAAVEGQPIRDPEVHCRQVAEAVDGILLSAMEWKQLSQGRIAEDIWWAVTPAAAAEVPQSGARSRNGGAVLLASISNALFGESVNLNQGSTRRHSTPHLAPQNGLNRARPIREEPAIYPDAGLAADVVLAAWADWCSILSKRFGLAADAMTHEQNAGRQMPADAGAVSTAALPSHLLRNWSGALYLTIPLCGQTLMLLLPAALAANCLKHEMPSADGQAAQGATAPAPAGASLAPFWNALASQATGIEVELTPMEIDLGSLTALQVGDVLRTGHSLDLPLVVKLRAPHAEDTAGTEVLCGGFLGRKGERRAVELL